MTPLILFLTLALGFTDVNSGNNSFDDPNSAPIVVEDIIGGIGGNNGNNDPNNP
jgi:hypothetical protein